MNRMAICMLMSLLATTAWAAEQEAAQVQAQVGVTLDGGLTTEALPQSQGKRLTRPECRVESYRIFPEGTRTKARRDAEINACAQGAGFAALGDGCDVQIVAGWGDPRGSSATMTVHSGSSCGGALFVAKGIKAFDAQITQPPTSGVATGSGNEFRYQSKPGFQGSDTFGVRAYGTGPDHRPYVLTGTVTVNVR